MDKKLKHLLMEYFYYKRVYPRSEKNAKISKEISKILEINSIIVCR